MTEWRYDVAFSFAGEDRQIVDYLARELHSQYQVFYDQFEEAQLWGTDLSESLPHRYVSSRFCVIIQSPTYLTKMWTTLERQAIVSEFLLRRGKDYVLPLRITSEECEIPGISAVTSYVRVRDQSQWPMVAALLKDKLSQ